MKKSKNTSKSTKKGSSNQPTTKVVIDATKITELPHVTGVENTRETSPVSKHTSSVKVDKGGNVTSKDTGTVDLGVASMSTSISQDTSGEVSHTNSIKIGPKIKNVGYEHIESSNEEQGAHSESHAFSLGKGSSNAEIFKTGNEGKPLALDPDVQHVKEFNSSGVSHKIDVDLPLVKIDGLKGSVDIGARADTVILKDNIGEPKVLHIDTVGAIDINLAGIGYSSEALIEKSSDEIADKYKSLDGQRETYEINLKHYAPDSQKYQATSNDIDSVEKSISALKFFEGNAIAREAEVSIKAGESSWIKTEDKANNIVSYSNSEMGQVLTVDREEKKFSYTNKNGETSNIAYENEINSKSTFVPTVSQVDEVQVTTDALQSVKVTNVENDAKGKTGTFVVPEVEGVGETSIPERYRENIKKINEEYKEIKQQLDQGNLTIKEGERLRLESSRLQKEFDALRQVQLNQEYNEVIDRAGKASLQSHKAETEQQLLEGAREDAKQGIDKANDILQQDIQNSQSSDLSYYLRQFDSDGDGELTDQEKFTAGRLAAENAYSSITSVIDGFEHENDALVFVSALDSVVNIDRVHQVATGKGSVFGELENELSGGAQLANGVYGLVNSLESDNEFGVLSNAVLALDGLNTIVDGNLFGEGNLQGGLGGFKLGEIGGKDFNLGGALSVLNFANAIDSGDSAYIASAGSQVYTTFMSGGDSVPGLNYVGAFVQLVDGNWEGAAVSAVSAYASTAVSSALTAAGYGSIAGPVGAAVAVVVSLILGSLFSSTPPDPEATLDFHRGEDGEFDYSTTKNKTGEGLEKVAENVGESFGEYLAKLEETYAVGLENQRFDINKIPSFEFDAELKDQENIRWSISGEGFGGQTKFDLGENPDGQEVARVFRDSILFAHVNEGWKIGEDVFIDANGIEGQETYYSPFASLLQPVVSEAVPIGEILQGEQIGGYQDVVSASKDSIVSDAIPMGTVQRELAEVQTTKGVVRGLFDGQAGQLIALGLATGFVSMEQLAAAAPSKIEEKELAKEYKALIEQYQGQYIVAGDKQGGLYQSTQSKVEFKPNESVSESISAFYQAVELAKRPDMEGVTVTINDRAPGEAVQITPPRQSNEPLLLGQGVLVRNENDIVDEALGLPTERVLVDDKAVSQVPTQAAQVNVSPVLKQSAPTVFTSAFQVLEDREGYTNTQALLQANPKYQSDWVFLGLGSAREGVVTLDAQGEVHFVPRADFSGDAGFDYQYRDSEGKVRDAQVIVEVVNVNDRPQAQDDELVLLEDTRVSLNELLHNDTDVDSHRLSIKGVSSVSAGSIEVDTNGGLHYVPEANYVGKVSIVYLVSDGVLTTTSRAELTYQEAQNDAPILKEVVLQDAVEDVPYELSIDQLLEHAQDPEGGALRLVDVRLVDSSLGSVRIDEAQGKVVITPALNVNGVLDLRYGVADEQGVQSQASLALHVRNTVDEYSTRDVSVSVQQNSVNVYRAQDIIDQSVLNPGGEPVQVTAVRVAGDHVGVARLLDNGLIEFRAAPNYVGETAFEVRFSNGIERLSSTYQVMVTSDMGNSPSGLSANAAVMNQGLAGNSVASDTVAAQAMSGSNSVTGSGSNGSSNVVSASGSVNSSVNASAPAQIEINGAVEDSVFEIAVADVLPAGSQLLQARLSDTSQGQLTHEGDRLRFVPAENVFGALALELEIENAAGETQTHPGTLYVAGLEDDFSIADKSVTVVEDAVTVLSASDLLAEYPNQKELDNQTLSITQVRSLANGNAVLQSDGSIEFIPENQFAGQTGFEYDVSDGVHTHTVRYDITVTAQDDAPVAEDDQLVGAVEDTVFRFDANALLNNDSDEEGSALSLGALSLVDASQGSLVVERGQAVFTPSDDVYGEVVFNYEVMDANGNLTIGRAVIDVEAADDPFTVTNKDFRNPIFGLNEDEARTFTREELLSEHAELGFKDRDGVALTFASVSMVDPALGSVELTNDGDVRFTPADNYVGEASFEVGVTDGVSTHTLTTTVKLYPVNDAPTVMVDQAQLVEDGEIRLTGADLLLNDQDADGDVFRIVGVWNQSHGVATYDARNDELRFTPDADYNGLAAVEYLVQDDKGAYQVARLELDVTPTPDAPEAVDDVIRTQEDTPFLFAASELIVNDKDVDGNGLMVASIDESGINHGVLKLRSDGQIEYIPEAEYSGEQTFTYTAVDSLGQQTTATAKLIVEQVNDGPTFTRGAHIINEDETVVFKADDLLTNVADIEGDWLSIQGARVDSDTNFGKVNFDAYSRQITFTPNEHFNSQAGGTTVGVEYLVVDEAGEQTWAAVDIEVSPVNDPPTAVDDLVFIWEGGAANYENRFAKNELLRNDSDIDGDNLTVSGVTGGISRLDNNDIVVRVDSVGRHSFEYEVSDGESISTATVQLQALENHAPESVDFITQSKEDTVLIFDWDDFRPHVSDVDEAHTQLPEILQIQSVGNASHGSVQLHNGQVRFVPTADFHSASGQVASFDYTVRDIVGNTTTSKAYINYTPVNDRPIAVGETLGSMDEDGAGFQFTLSQLLQNDRDIDSTNLSISGLSVNTGGQLIYRGGETYRFVPNKHFNGTAVINYTVSDGSLTDNTQARIVVNSVNDPPYIRAIAPVQGIFGQGNVIKNLLNQNVAGDVDGDRLRLEITDTAGAVKAHVSGDRIIWDDRDGGSGSISYRVVDEHGARSDVVTVNTQTANTPPMGLHIDNFYGRINFGYSPDFVYILDINVPSFYLEVSGKVDVESEGAGDVTYQFSSGIHTNGAPSRSFDVDVNTGQFSVATHISPMQFTVSATDSIGNSTHRTFTIHVPPSFEQPIYYSPIVLDLNKNGLQLTSAVASLAASSEAAARFDWDDTGVDNATGWIAGKGDGILAYDWDEDGKVTHANEISFVEYLDGAETDLQGLRAFDSDGDGVFSANDDKWDKFAIWVDDGDAESEEGELKSLESLGVESISLTSDENQVDDSGNTIHGIASVTLKNGEVIDAGDVSFAAFSDEVSIGEEELEFEVEEGEEIYSIINETAVESDAILLEDNDDAPKEEGESDTSSVESDTSSTESETSSVESETSSVESETSSTESDTSSTESDTSSTESDTSSTESDTSSTESDTSSTESDTSSTESDTSSTESDTSSTESDTSSTESDTSSTESDTSSTESDTSSVESEKIGDDQEEISDNKESTDSKKEPEDDLPSDDEIDRRAAQGASDAASMESSTSVSEADSDPESVVSDSNDDENHQDG